MQWDVGPETEKNGLITSVEPTPPPIIEHIDMRGYRKSKTNIKHRNRQIDGL